MKLNLRMYHSIPRRTTTTLLLCLRDVYTKAKRIISISISTKNTTAYQIQIAHRLASFYKSSEKKKQNMYSFQRRAIKLVLFKFNVYSRNHMKYVTMFCFLNFIKFYNIGYLPKQRHRQLNPDRRLLYSRTVNLIFTNYDKYRNILIILFLFGSRPLNIFFLNYTT